MFAPSFHPAMKYAIAPRRELGIRTVFNILGPLTNPASVKFQVLGVFDSNLTEMMAQVLMNLGTEHALIVHGMEGLDEVSISGKTKITELYKGKMETYFVTPKDFGIKSLKIEEIQKMGDPKENARDLVSILNNKQGPLYDLTLVNAAAALKAAKNIPLLEGLELAKESIESGKAYNKLKSFIKISSNNTSILEKLEEDLWES
jgi:anthranilate phosphoribosyltransferase